MVETPLRVTISPSHVRAESGQPVTLNCNSEGGPAVAQSWYKDGQLVQAQSRVQLYGTALHITQVRRGDVGLYQCEVQAPSTAALATAHLALAGLCALPTRHDDSSCRTMISALHHDDNIITITILILLLKTLQPGAAATLKCAAHGSPAPRLRWLLDGVPLVTDDRVTSGWHVGGDGTVVGHVNISSARVRDGGVYTCLTEAHAGNYTCTAVNPVRTVHYTARLTVNGTPCHRLFTNRLV
ncbi:hypothetical protein HAZT_HAZT008886 [Hyalella azteca]|uniref:Ig-like domain-containing protein n=1 Tax=Hyalella azteca TaxID=294128 RepID=A0A6A0H3Y6_HYAAZ|nr:hypothetical protein HAZT_HAZT008886 [Hyalella azteca]